MPNRPNGGDPFIVRGQADLIADLTGSVPVFAFEELKLLNPDIDQDDRADYTLGALARNAILYGEELLNSLDIPGFAGDLLGQLGLGEATRDESLERPRGMLLDEPIETPEAASARLAINGFVSTALTAAGNDGQAVDQEALKTQIRDELAAWLDGASASAGSLLAGSPLTPSPSPPNSDSPEARQSLGERGAILRVRTRTWNAILGAEGEEVSIPILQRLLDVTSPQVDDPETPEDEFEITLNLALSSYERWIEAVETAELTPEDVATSAQLELLQTRLINALRFAIRRAHVQAIELHLAGAPLNHTYDEAGALNQRGVLDRAVEAIKWAQSAEFLDLHLEHPELSVKQAYEDLVVRVNVGRAELIIPEGREIQDDYIGPDDSVQLEVETTWQIKLPSNGTPDIATLFPSSPTTVTYDFGAEITDAGQNVEILAIGDANNNQIGGEVINREEFTFIPLPLTGVLSPVSLPLEGDLAPVPITRMFADSGGKARAAVTLGEGDTDARVNVSVSLNQVQLANITTNAILGRPSIDLLAADLHQDDSGLRDDRLYVISGTEKIVRASLRRGNGPLADASVAFFIDGEGSFTAQGDTKHTSVHRTPPDGFALVEYYARPDLLFSGAPVVVGATFYENGTAFTDTVELLPANYPEFIQARDNPLASGQPSEDPDTVALREQIAVLSTIDFDELAEQTRADLVALVTSRLGSLVTQSQNVVAQTEDVAAGVDAAADASRQLAADYFEWLSHASLTDFARNVDQTTVETNLVNALQNLADYWLEQFDGTAVNGGLRPLYESLRWGAAIENLISINPDLLNDTTLIQDRIIAFSDLAVEFDSPPQLTGNSDDATFTVQPRLVVNTLDGQVAVEHDPGVKAPVEIRVVPAGLSEFYFDHPAEQQPNENVLQTNRDGFINQQRVIWSGSHLQSDDQGGQQLVEWSSAITGSANRGDGEPELRLSVAFGIPGIILRTENVILQDPIRIRVRGALDTEDDNALRDSLSITSTQRVVLQAEVTRGGLPAAGEIEFSLIGRGELTELGGWTGQSGVYGGVEFLPPVRPSSVQEDVGTTLVSVSVVDEGIVKTDYITIRYEYRDNAHTNVDGTPDYHRAMEELDTALRLNTSIDPQIGPEVNFPVFNSDAIDVLRDWFEVDATDAVGEGSVTKWLQDVQPVSEGGAYGLDLAWNDDSGLRDQAFRTALRDATRNWLRWLSVVELLGLTPEGIVGNDNAPGDLEGLGDLRAAGDLVVGGFLNAIARSHARCEARANEYLAAPSDTIEEREHREELLERLITEGGQVLKYYNELQVLEDVKGIVLPNIDFDDLLGQLCYQVEIVEEESYLIGRPESAQVRVKAGIRVDGVDELIVPERSMPLVVVIDPIGNANLSGVGVGRTDSEGVYERVRVSAGPRESSVAVNATVIFTTLELNPDSKELIQDVRGFATRRLTLDNTVRSGLIWTKSIPDRVTESLPPTSNAPTTQVLRGGETAEIEFKLQRGRAPLPGQFVEITLLGEGTLYTPTRVTDASGRIRFEYDAPIFQSGRARIALSYSVDGRIKTETLTINYSDEDAIELDPVYSRAHVTAENAAALLVSQAALQAQLGSDIGVDQQGLIDAMTVWRDSGLNPDGTLNENQDFGVRSRIVEAENVSLDSRERFFRRALTEYIRWRAEIASLGLQDEFDTAVDQQILTDLSALAKSSIDDLVAVTLDTLSPSQAKQTLRIALAADEGGLLDVGDLSNYSLDAVKDRLGYEIQIDEARLHGQADDAWLQVVVRLYLHDQDAGDGSKIRADGDTPIQLNVQPLGFSLSNGDQLVTNGVYGASASIVRGDTDLRVILRASDEFYSSESIQLDRPGKSRLVAAGRLESAASAALDDQVSLLAGQQARIEGIVTKGLGRVGFRDVLYSVEGAPPNSIQRVPNRSDAFIFTPPEGQSGTATITLSLQADGTILQSSIEISFSDQAAPEGEQLLGGTAMGGSGLLNNSHAVGAFNDVSVPLAGDDDAGLGSAFGLGSFQFPFSGGLPPLGTLARDAAEFLSQSIDLLHIADLETLLGFLNGLPSQPEDIVRFKFDLAAAGTFLPETTFAADFSGVLPDGMEGNVRLDRPELGGQVVFGIDTSSSPLYVLTGPDRLLTNNPTFEDFLSGGIDEVRDVGREVTQLAASFGVGASFRSNQPLIDGILEIPSAEGYLVSKVKVDFSEVARQTGKLRLTNLSELANLHVGFDGDPLDSFHAIASARVTLPNLAGINDNNHPLANVEAVAAIQKGDGGLFEFQLRTADLFELPQTIAEALSVGEVSQADDVLEPNDDWRKIDRGDSADLGRLTDRVIYDELELSDSADWYRFETTDEGDAASFVRVDFDRTRGDLDLGLYRLVDDELVHIRSDGLAFGNSASITLLGQPVGTYFIKVFDDAGGLQPYYALTIDPPGKPDPGIDVMIGDFEVVDTSLEITVNSDLEFTGFLDGRMLVTFGQQEEVEVEDPVPGQPPEQIGTQVPVEVDFRAVIDTVVDDPDDNGGLFASLSSELSDDAIQVLDLRDADGAEIPPPANASWRTLINPSYGGYLIFDYVSNQDFKFAGYDAKNDRFVIGESKEGDAWKIPSSPDSTVSADLNRDRPFSIELITNGNTVELWVKETGLSARKILVKTIDSADPLLGQVGLGSPDGTAAFYEATLRPIASEEPIFVDVFAGGVKSQWKLRKGIWSANERSWVGYGTKIILGEVLRVEQGKLTASIDVQFNDANLLSLPESINASVVLENVDALLLPVEEGEDGARLYEDDETSAKGLVAINGGFVTITPEGVSLGVDEEGDEEGSVRAVWQDVLHVDIFGAELNLTTDLSKPLLKTGDIRFRIPALSADEDFVTISGSQSGDLLGISKPTLSDPIPEFLLFQDQITIDFNTGLIQDKIDIGGVFPFSLDRVGIRFNDAGDESGQIGNLTDFSLLVAGNIDFTNEIFDGLPFDPIFAIGQPDIAIPVGQTGVRLSNADAYADTCDSSLIEGTFGEAGLCQNGFLSAELNLGSLLGNEGPLLEQLGPIFIGFDNVSVTGAALDGGLSLHGLMRIEGFQDGVFVPEFSGEIAVRGTGQSGDPLDGTPLGELAVVGKFLGPVRVNSNGEEDPNGTFFERSLEMDWRGEISGEIGGRFNVSTNEAAFGIKTIFTNTYNDQQPFNLSAEIIPQTFDTGLSCIDIGGYVQLCGEAFVNLEAGADEPFMIIEQGGVFFGESLGPLATDEDTQWTGQSDTTGIRGGGFGIGRDGTVYAIPRGYTIPDPNNLGETIEFTNGAYIELMSDLPGGIFGLPEWVPVEVRELGLEFIGIGEPDAEGNRDTLTVAPPTDEQIKSVGAVPGVLDLGGEILAQAQPITDPDNLRLVISGGFVGAEYFPIVGDFERVQVNLGKLAGCVAVAADQYGIDVVNDQTGYIFDSACDFPVEGLEGLTIGIQPFELLGLTVGGTVGFGVFNFDNEPVEGTADFFTQNVFYASLEGEIGTDEFGLGLSGIITQYGPILLRAKAGVPIPISTIIGAVGGPIGAGLGAAAGFLLSGLEGGIVFDSDPLPVIEEPTDLFSTPKFRTPLKVTPGQIREEVKLLASKNPTFSELVAEIANLGSDITVQEALIDLLGGQIPGLSVEFTWDKGYRMIVSGTLTNQYAAGQLGLDVTLGMNVGYDFDVLRHPNGQVAMDGEGNALDADGNQIFLDEDGNRVEDGISGTLQTFDDLFGFQLFGFADIEAFGLPIVGAGVLFDFKDPINPIINVAASLPAKDGWLSLLLPAQGAIGASLDFKGLVEGNILSTLVLIGELQSGTNEFLGELFDALGDDVSPEINSPLRNLANLLEADRRHALGLPLDDPSVDPQLTGYTPGMTPNASPDLWLRVLDLDNDGSTTIEEQATPITRTLLIDRMFGGGGIQSIIPNVQDLPADPAELSTQLGQLVNFGLVRITSAFMQELITLGPAALVNGNIDASGLDVPFWEAIENQMIAAHESARAFANDEQTALMDDAFAVSLNTARISAALSYVAASATSAAAQKYAEVIDPKLRITGQLSPMFLGIPMGPPSQEVDVTISKNELTVRGTFSIMKQMLNMAAIPAIVADQTKIDVHFPFVNLLEDLYAGQIPRIDPLADDWRIALEASASVLGFELQNQIGMIFPAGATQLFEERVQIYDPEAAGENTVTLEPNKILVRADDEQLLLDQGGILFDGRLTLPRFVTDPVGLWNDLISDPNFQADIEAIDASNCDDIWSCITANPTAVFGILSRLPQQIQAGTSIETVSQVQMYVPNFIDNIIESFDDQTRAELDALLATGSGATADDVISFIQDEVGDALGSGYDRLQDAYLKGSYGKNPALANPPFPTTSKILGIDLGDGTVDGRILETGFDIDLFGTFMGLVDVRFEANLNTDTGDTFEDLNGNGVYDAPEPLIAGLDRSPVGIYNEAEPWTDANVNGLADPGEYQDLDGNGLYDPAGDPFNDLNFNGSWDAGEPFTDSNGNGVYDPALVRVGGEFVLGTVPAEYGASPSAWRGASDVNSIKQQLGAFLAQSGLSPVIDSVGGTVGDAFEWLDLDAMAASGGLLLRAYSPGFDPASDLEIQRRGGIEAYAGLNIENFGHGDFRFDVSPPSGQSTLPSVSAFASLSQVFLPGLEGLSPDDDDPAFGSALTMGFGFDGSALSSSLSGSITVLGQTFTLSGDQSLEIFDDGFVASVGLGNNVTLGGAATSQFEASGNLVLEIDTRLSEGPSASIRISDGRLYVAGVIDMQLETATMTVDASGLHLTDVNGSTELLDFVDLTYGGSVSISPIGEVDIDLSSAMAIEATVGPGTIAGNIDVFVDSTGIHGDFTGSGTVFGSFEASVSGTFDSTGCIALTDPVEAHFELPGLESSTLYGCGAARQVAIGITIGDVSPVLEGGQGTSTSVSVPVLIQRFGTTDVFEVEVPWTVTPVGSGIALPQTTAFDITSNLNFDANGRTTITLDFNVVGDDAFSPHQDYIVSIDVDGIRLESGLVTWNVNRAETTLTVLNDDTQDLSALRVSNDAISYFDFDQDVLLDGLRVGTTLDRYSANGPASTTDFASRPIRISQGTTRGAADGLPVFLDLYNAPGAVEKAPSVAFVTTMQTDDSLPTLEFTVHNGLKWIPQGIEFFTTAGPNLEWELYWDLDGFSRPVLTSGDSTATTMEYATLAPGWTRHRNKQIQLENLFCNGQPRTFRLVATDAESLVVDNLALLGKESPGCGTTTEWVAEIEEFLEQQDHRLPGPLQIVGPGVPTIWTGPDPDDPSPNASTVLHIDVAGTNDDQTIIRFADDGRIETADELAKLFITTDGGARFIDLGGTGDLFRGNLTVGGHIREGLQLGGLTNGSSVVINNAASDLLNVVANGRIGNDVSFSTNGSISSLQVTGSWESGELSAHSIGGAFVSGDFGASVDVQKGVNAFRTGGDLRSPLFRTGLAPVDRDGSSGQIVAQGGNLSGTYIIDGDSEGIQSIGGSTNADVTVFGTLALVLASVGTSENGGNIDGVFTANAFESVESYGGTIAATLNSLDPGATAAAVSAYPLGGRGGIIDSPNSFHFAGGIRSIVGNQINLRVESGGHIGKIIAVDDGPDRPASLTGRFTAHTFGSVETDENGIADFELTTTAEAWELNGDPAFQTILVQPGSSWLQDQLHLQPGTNPGQILVHGEVDQPLVNVSVLDSQAYADAGQMLFEVRLETARNAPVSLFVQTNDGTLKSADGDYTAVSSMIEFSAGEVSKLVPVPLGWALGTLNLQISNPVGALIVDGNAQGTVELPLGGDADLADNNVEFAAPNQGDGNDDGILDMRQDHVVSLVSPQTDQYVTFAGQDNLTFTAVGFNNAPAAAVPPGAQTPAGMLDLALSSDSESTVVEVFFESPLAVNTVFASFDGVNWQRFDFNSRHGAELLGADGDGSVESMRLQLAPEDASSFDGGLTNFDIQLVPAAIEQSPSATFDVIGTSGFDLVRVTWRETSGEAVVQLNDQVIGTFAIDQIDLVTIDTGGGDDWIIVEETFPISLYVDAGPGNDLIYGGQASDTLIGGNGRDLIFAAAGDDWIDSGNSNDLVYGGPGDDMILGGVGHDVAYGGTGNDTIEGGAGRNILVGNGGDDVLEGGSQQSRIFGGIGDDLVLGGNSRDFLYGGDGNDEIRGRDGNDFADGGEGDDRMFGGIGDDRLLGGAGDDLIEGEVGDDRLFGQTGNDRLFGGAGNDFVKGGFGNDLLLGEAGNDRLSGEWGDDRLEGGSGADTLLGGPGTDELIDDSTSGGEPELIVLDPLLSRDVNGDGRISPLDALLIINQLARGTSGGIAVESELQQRYDSNGDDQISPRDALLVINYLAAERRYPSEESLGETLSHTADEIAGSVADAASQQAQGLATDIALALLDNDNESLDQASMLIEELVSSIEE